MGIKKPTDLLTLVDGENVEHGVALWHVVDEEFDGGHDVLYPDVLVDGPLVDVDVFGVEVAEEPGQRLAQEAGVAPEDGVPPDPQLQGVLPQVDAALELEGVGVRGPPVDQAPDHVLVGGAQDTLADEQALDPEPVPVQAHGLQRITVIELHLAPEKVKQILSKGTFICK